MRKIITILVTFFLFSCSPKSKFQEGDIIFQTSLSHQSKAIQLATDSPYSHVGIIAVQENKLYVLEAVQPVKLTPLKTWIEQGKDHTFVLKRLKDRSVLTSQNREKMRAVATGFIGKNYDKYFDWSNDKIYCSELVWKIYKFGVNVELGSLRKLKDFNLDDPIVSQMLHQRYGKNIPFDEPVIAPSDIYKSDFLMEVN